LTVHHASRPAIDWQWLCEQPVARETQFLRHASLAAPLDIRLDGRSGRGAIWRGGPPKGNRA
jgi:hypothetical protein